MHRLICVYIYVCVYTYIYTNSSRQRINSVSQTQAPNALSVLSCCENSISDMDSALSGWWMLVGAWFDWFPSSTLATFKPRFVLTREC